VLEEYITKSVNEKEIKNIMEEQDIPFRDFRRQSDTLFMRLNKLEAFILNEILPDSLSVTNKVNTTQTYRFLVPSKGEIINIDNLSLVLYKQLIVQEQGKKARVKDDKLFIDGEEQKKYTFQDDYYWALSDNTLNAVDSRTLGFIPFKNIIGKAHTIWYSAEKNGFCFSSLSE
jgi:signal peptidase I